MARYFIRMSSYPLVLTGNDASPFILVFVCVEVSVESTTEADKKVALHI